MPETPESRISDLSPPNFTVNGSMTNGNADKSHEQFPPDEREARVHKLIHVDLEGENSPAFPAIVTNLSSHGMGGHTEGYLRPFEVITIIKKGYGRISGEVRWTEGENFGILFAEPVDVDLFNFSNQNKKKQFVPQASEDEVWRGFEAPTSTRRPGLTNQYSRN